MKRSVSSITLSIPILALAGALLVPTIATGAVYRLKGKVRGDANGTVSLKVVVRRGKPQRLKAVMYSNLDGFCDQDDSVGYETPAGERSGSLSGSTSIEFGGAFMGVRHGSNPQRVGIFGKVKQRGKKVKATIEVYFDSFCKAGGTFVARPG